MVLYILWQRNHTNIEFISNDREIPFWEIPWVTPWHFLLYHNVYLSKTYSLELFLCPRLLVNIMILDLTKGVETCDHELSISQLFCRILYWQTMLVLRIRISYAICFYNTQHQCMDLLYAQKQPLNINWCLWTINFELWPTRKEKGVGSTATLKIFYLLQNCM